MSFFDHFDELRIRLMRVLAVFMGGMIIVYVAFSEFLMDLLRQPLFKLLPEDQRKLYFTNLFENFLTHLKISAYGAIFLISPYVFYEVWGFIAPGLYDRERRYALPFILAATGFFVCGALFAYFILFPVGFHFFVTYGGPAEVPLLTIDSYYTTCIRLLLLFGLAFELPVLVTLLGFLGIVDSTQLRENRKAGILVITVVCALFAPPDAVSMLILMAPLIAMFEGSILVVSWFERKRRDSASGDSAPGLSR